jgi:intergrase/recombinase
MEPRAGFGPATITLPMNNNIDLELFEFEKWITAKYSISYRRAVLCYVKKYKHLLSPSSNLRDLELLSNDVKSSTVKSLILFSKFKGTCTQFKAKLDQFGVKLYRPDSLNAFLRILNASSSDVMAWYENITPALRPNEQLFAKFLLYSGLRTSEAINSFNKIIELSKENRISEYFDQNLVCLCHFKYPKQFIRRTKNCFITFITPEFLNEIANSEKVNYNTIRKRLERQDSNKMRFNELRDYFGTYLLHHGLLEQEVNLLQGRIPVSVFIRHYWSPKLKELAIKVFKTLETI